MNLKSRHPGRARRGTLLAEAVVALAILVTVMLPLAFMFLQETHLCRGAYFKAVAMEIVDGEMEILAAGEWHAFQPGRQPYPVRVPAASNLPPGIFQLTLEGQKARLEWIPKRAWAGGVVVREAVMR
ncbi:MAG: hypothetical protein QOF48_965 [Verrucomicrobiota bacterium]